MSSAFTFAIKTMGCKANIYDSLVLEKELIDLGGSPSSEKPDLFVLNSCTVTAEADRKSDRELHLIRKSSPETWTVVTGCYAQVGARQLQGNPNVDFVAGNDGKHGLKALVAQKFGLEVPLVLSEEVYWGQLPSFRGKTRAFLKIQEGCNDYCTYCIIPYARGKSRSVELSRILAECDRLAEEGIREIVLTGTNIADYGKEWQMGLEDLVEAILRRTKVSRLRLTSLDPTEITDRLIGMMEPGGVLLPHFHVSLQNASSRVLRAMKRHYRSEEVISCLEKIHAHSPEIFAGMDYIAGFPGETDDEHAESVRLLKGLPWARLHVFPYSERGGTPALKIPGSVPIPLRRARAQELLALSRQRHEEFVRRYLGRQIEGVLLESKHEVAEETWITGHAPNYIRIVARIPASKQADWVDYRGKIGSVRVETYAPKPAQDFTLECVLQ